MDQGAGTVNHHYADPNRQSGTNREESPEEIRARIERTRAEMSDTVETIQRRLSPDRLRYEAQESVREAAAERIDDMKYRARRKARTVTDTIKDNPVPAALIGLGLGWLLMSGPDQDDEYDEYGQPYPYGGRRTYYAPGQASGAWNDQYVYETENAYPTGYAPYSGQGNGHSDSGKIDELQQKAGETVNSIQESAGDLSDSAREQARQMSEQMQMRAEQARYRTRYRARRAKRGFQQSMEENPLAMGAVALAVGAAIGLSAPNTDYEDELVGEYRDQLIHEARQQARQTADKVKQVAETTQETAMESLQESAQTVKESAREEAKRQDLVDSNETQTEKTG